MSLKVFVMLSDTTCCSQLCVALKWSVLVLPDASIFNS